MESRKKDLLELQSYIRRIDSEVTLILQQLQWDQNNLIKGTPMVGCEYNANHRVPASSKEAHEKKCFLDYNGYSKDEILLPDPLDSNSSTLIRFSSSEINEIINNAVKADPSFKGGVFTLFSLILYHSRGSERASPQPLSLGRLQAALSPDERRALHDAAVRAAPACHDLTELVLISENEGDQKKQAAKSRTEVLAELRDMKRRRAKYRVAAKTGNYSHVLRDLIRTQMEIYTDVKEEHNAKIKEEEKDQHHRSNRNTDRYQSNSDRDQSRKNIDRSGETSHNERKRRDEKSRNDDDRHLGHSQSRYNRDRTSKDNYDVRERDYKHGRRDKDKYWNRSKDRSSDRSHGRVKRERHSDSETSECTEDAYIRRDKRYKTERDSSTSGDSRRHSDKHSSKHKDHKKYGDDGHSSNELKMKKKDTDYEEYNRKKYYDYTRDVKRHK